jgi:hypothetical protein
MSSGTRGDLVGRLIGMLVFLLGVGLLVWVFAIAYGLFTANPATVLGLHITGDPKKDPGVALIGTNFGWLLFRIAFLFIMSLSGSFIAQKGINLYFSAVMGHPVNATVRHVQAVQAAASASSTVDAGH